MRRQDQWIELADTIDLDRATVVACMTFLNLRRPVGWVARELRLPVNVVGTIARQGKTLLRRPDAEPSFPKGRGRRTELKCVYCGSRADLTRDHVVPKSRGGSDDPSNIVVACRTCNCSKGDRTPEEWLCAG